MSTALPRRARHRTRRRPAILEPARYSRSGPAYLGAFVDTGGQQLSLHDPTGETGGNLYGPPDAVQEMSELPQFNKNLAKPLSLVSVYQSWTSPVLTTQLDQILVAGAVPLITWGCGAPDATVAEADSQNPAASAARPSSPSSRTSWRPSAGPFCSGGSRTPTIPKRL